MFDKFEVVGGYDVIDVHDADKVAISLCEKFHFAKYSFPIPFWW